MKINKGCIYKKGDKVRCIKRGVSWEAPSVGSTYIVMFSRFLAGEEHIYIGTKQYRDWYSKRNKLVTACNYYPISLFEPLNKNIVRRSKLLNLKKIK